MSVGLLRMPRLGETMEEGRLVAWLVEPGTPFRRGDVIADVETDKTVVEMPALGSGTLTETLVEPGATVAVGDPIARVEIGDGIDWTRETDDGGDGVEESGSGARDAAVGGNGGERPATADGAGAGPGPGRLVVDLPMPRLGETMEEGTLVTWLVEAGAAFSRGDPLLEVETDKTVAEVPALANGVLTQTLATEGQRIAVGTPIARVEIDAGDRAAMLGDATGAADTPTAADGPAVRKASAPEGPVEMAPPTGGPRRATPLARRIARQRGVELAGVTGTGRRGRIEKRDVEAAAAGSAEEGPQVRAGIAYREQGPRDGAPVLLVHGFAADHTAWAAAAAHLARAGRRTVAIDLPSHGRSGREAGDAGALGEALCEFADEVFDGAPVHVVAHSLGAVPAIALAARDMARSLILIAPAGLGLSIDDDFIRGLVEARTPGEVAHLLRRMTAGPLGLSETAIAAIAGELSRGRLAALADAVLGARGQAIDIRGPLADLAERVPVRLILGHRDRIIDWRECLDVSPRIAVHHLPEAGHMPQWEAPGPVAAILAAATEDA